MKQLLLIILSFFFLNSISICQEIDGKNLDTEKNLLLKNSLSETEEKEKLSGIDFPLQSDTYKFDNNRYNMPINNKGVLADVSIQPEVVSSSSSGILFGTNKLGGYLEYSGLIGANGLSIYTGFRYEMKPVLYAGGFMMVGKNQDEWWANGVFYPFYYMDYLPGVPGTPNDPRYEMYVLRSSDPPFGESWQNWRNAVLLGADFYDGDGDGLYNPVDLNGNGKWDASEDRPDLLGDLTAWCIYNDSKPVSQRRIYSEPLGIIIKQTVFSVLPDSAHQVDNMFFVRYRISQNGSVTEKLDSVYFMILSDPEIGINFGAFMDDLVGCDTLLNSGYAYNDGDDPHWGVNPPAIASSLLQGPAIYVPGVSFMDNNFDGKYDPGIDTPLDTAYYRKGYHLGSSIFPGAMNLNMNSFIHFMETNTTSEPFTVSTFKNFARGLNRVGNNYDPCTWPFGEVRGGVPCNSVNPIFMYSGNPINNKGWINILPTDQRIALNIGPFELISNQEIDIWMAYVVGRGSDALNSISVMKENVQYAIESYRSNFLNLPGAEPIEFIVLPDRFSLYQNYPNPFNPGTKIRWQSPVGSHQVLKVFDVLGREVATLVDEFRNAGIYEAEFDGSNYASGVYFYQLKASPIGRQAGDYFTTKKMTLIK